MPQDSSKNLRTLAQRKKQPKIPTADEEALEAPTIDPVMFAALATTMGPVAAAKALVQQVGANALFQGIPEGLKRAEQYLPRASTQDVLDMGYGAVDAQRIAGKDLATSNPENWGTVIRKGLPDSATAGKIGSILDKLTKTPEAADEERLTREAIDKLIKAGDWARRMEPPT